jgi:hypothetical protein
MRPAIDTVTVSKSFINARWICLLQNEFGLSRCRRDDGILPLISAETRALRLIILRRPARFVVRATRNRWSWSGVRNYNTHGFSRPRSPKPLRGWGAFQRRPQDTTARQMPRSTLTDRPLPCQPSRHRLPRCKAGLRERGLQNSRIWRFLVIKLPFHRYRAYCN